MTPLISRREALRQVAWLMGGAISAPAVLGVLNGCSAKQEAQWKPAFLTQAQGAVVAEIAEIMIPRTDTPGANDVGVPAFIDSMLKDAYGQDDQKRFIAGLEEFEAQCQRDHQKAFLKLEPEQRVSFVQTAHDAAVAHEREKAVPFTRLERPFILMTKELTLLGFFTSQAGATQVLQYVQVPGAYHGCLPRSQAGNGKTWAQETSALF